MKTKRLSFAFLVVVCALAGALLLFPASPVRESARRSVAGSNLRQIGQASLIYASEHGDKLPRAENVWDYAAELARDTGLNDAAIWVLPNDPAGAENAGGPGTVLTADRRGTDPAFRAAKPSWAVPLGELSIAGRSAVTPIAWTRGLRPDGTWAPHSPSGTAGGHIVFLGGNVVFHRDTKDVFSRFEGSGATSNVLEALPPGTRIGEYVPSEAEARSWARMRRWMEAKAAMRPAAGPALWGLALAVLIVQVARKRWPLWVLVLFLALSLLLAVATPTVGRVREI